MILPLVSSVNSNLVETNNNLNLLTSTYLAQQLNNEELRQVPSHLSAALGYSVTGSEIYNFKQSTRDLEPPKMKESTLENSQKNEMKPSLFNRSVRAAGVNAENNTTIDTKDIERGNEGASNFTHSRFSRFGGLNREVGLMPKYETFDKELNP